MFDVNERRAVVAVATAGTIYAGSRFGLIKLIPDVGPVGAPLVTIALGAVLSVLWTKDGTFGAALEGVGYGLIATGVMEIGA